MTGLWLWRPPSPKLCQEEGRIHETWLNGPEFRKFWSKSGETDLFFPLQEFLLEHFNIILFT